MAAIPSFLMSSFLYRSALIAGEVAAARAITRRADYRRGVAAWGCNEAWLHHQNNSGHPIVAKFHENRSQPFISKRRDFLVARSGVDIAKTISVGDKFLGGPSVILIDPL